MATVTVFPIANTSSTPRVSGTVSYGGSTQSVFIQVLSTTWATDSPAIMATLVVDQSFDSGSTWRPFGSTDFVPGRMSKDGLHPQQVQWQAGDTLGARLLRATLTASAPITMGLSATVT